jgi:uncharacterized membrane protein
METNIPPISDNTPLRNNTLAIASLILGIVGFILSCLGFFTAAFFVGYACGCVGFLLGVAALVTGFMARNQIAESGEGGNGMAIAGIILGGVQVILLLCAIFVILVLTLLGPVIGNVFSTINQSLK